VTGLVTDVDAGAEEKRLELLLEMVPKAHRIAFVGLRVDWEDAGARQFKAEAAKRDVKLLFVEGKRTDFSGALETLRQENADAFFVALSPLTTQFASSFGEFTVANRLPSSCAITEMVDRGCLMAYGQSVASVIVRSLTYVDRILKGSSPVTYRSSSPGIFTWSSS
jgi:putative ABC transport system substrate-binding protein